MKTKKILLLSMLIVTISIKAQFTDFVTQQVGYANQIVLHNNTLYFTTEVYNPSTWEYNYYIKKIDLSASVPVASVLYGPFPNHKSFWDLVVLGNTLYTVYYNETTNYSTIASFNLNDSDPMLTDHTNIYGHIKAMAIHNGYLYFSQINGSGGVMTLKKISTTFTTNWEHITNLGVTNLHDMAFHGNILYLANQGIKTIDISQASPTVATLKTGNFYEGIYVSGNNVWYSDTGIIKRFPISNPNDVTEFTVSAPTYTYGIVDNGMDTYVAATGRIATVSNSVLAISTENFSFSKNKNLLYPNPSQDILNFSENINNIKIYDITGRLIKLYNSDYNKIDVSDLAKGNYILKGGTEAGMCIVEKFVKN